MPIYRCYLLGLDDQLVSVQELRRQDDQQAIAWANGVLREKQQYWGIELWQASRLVHRRRRSPSAGR